MSVVPDDCTALPTETEKEFRNTDMDSYDEGNVTLSQKYSYKTDENEESLTPAELDSHPNKPIVEMKEDSVIPKKVKFVNPIEGKAKLFRHKRKPSRYQDCLFDVPTKQMNTNRMDAEEDFKVGLKKTNKPTKSKISEVCTTDKSPLQKKQSFTTPAFQVESSDHCMTFDDEGNFRFKVCKEHTVRSKSRGMTSYKCDICDMLFPRSFSLRRHYERIHVNPRFIKNRGKKDQEIVNKLLKEENAKKKNTKESSTSKGTSTDNVQEDSSHYLYACKLCNKYHVLFKTKDELRRHHQTKHNNLIHKLTDAFKCESCDRSYSTRHELRRHKRSHSGERPYACRFCGKRFPTSTNARRHERTHTGDRPHICKVCNKGFIQKTDMIKHLRAIHRMKVTKTKAERAGKKRITSDSKHQIEEILVEDKSNQFEENIDFAAYLNLDQFEKGSLMGGTSNEMTLQPRLNAAGTDGKNDCRIQPTLSNGSKKILPVENSCKEATSSTTFVPLHSCAECSKSFSSQVNLRRHFRLKHERNQVVRSALPVSMVVAKFKIQDEIENENEVSNNEIGKKLPDIQMNLEESKPSILSAENNHIPTADYQKTKDETSSSTGFSLTQQNAGSRPDIVNNNTSVASFLNPKGNKKPQKQGFKLGRILERLNNKNKIGDLTGSTQSCDPTPSKNVKKVDDTVVSLDKSSLPVRLHRRKAHVLARSEIEKIKKFSECRNDYSANIKSTKVLRENSRCKLLPVKASSVHTYKKVFHQQLDKGTLESQRSSRDSNPCLKDEHCTPYSTRYHNYQNSPSISHPRRNASNSIQYISNCIPKYMPKCEEQCVEGCPSSHLRKTAFNAPCSINHHHFHRRTERYPEEAPSNLVHYMVNEQYTNKYQTPHLTSFADDCWNSKMNNVQHSGVVHPPHLEMSKFRGNSLLAPTKPLMSFCYPERRTSDNLERCSCCYRPEEFNPDINDFTDVPDGNDPLDLRHPSKTLATKYVVTEEGILDFSKTTRDKLSGQDAKKLKVPSKPNVLRDHTPNSNFDLSVSVTPSDNDLTSVGIRKHRNSREQIQDYNMYSGYHSSSRPSLKFHNVEFDKGRQVHGAGTAGRPAVKFQCNSLSNSNMTLHHMPKPISNQYNAGNASLTKFHAFNHENAHVNRFNNYRHGRFAPLSGRYKDLRPTMREHVFRRQKRSSTHPYHINSGASFLPPRHLTSDFEHPSYYSPSMNRMHLGSQHRNMSESNHRNSSRIQRKQFENIYQNDRFLPKEKNYRKSNMNRVFVATSLSSAKPRRNVEYDKDDKDVMTRCIRKAQHELKLNNVVCSHSNHSQSLQLETDKCSSSFDQKLNFLETNNTERQGQLDKDSESAMLLESILPIPLPISPNIHQPEEKGLIPYLGTSLSIRSKLTMTPGFDTNGEDSSHEGGEKPSSPACVDVDNFLSTSVMSNEDNKDLKNLPSKVGLDQDNAYKSKQSFSGPKLQSSNPIAGTLLQGMMNSDKDLSCEQDEIDKLLPEPLDATTPAVLQPEVLLFEDPQPLESSVASSSTIDIRDETTLDHMIKETNLSTIMDKPSFKETNLFKEDQGDIQEYGQKPSVNAPLLVTEEADANHLESFPTKSQKNTEQTANESDCPRKFVQKLKLRAVKSQEKDGAIAKQWTLVGNESISLENLDATITTTASIDDSVELSASQVNLTSVMDKLNETADVQEEAADVHSDLEVDDVLGNAHKQNLSYEANVNIDEHDQSNILTKPRDSDFVDDEGRMSSSVNKSSSTYLKDELELFKSEEFVTKLSKKAVLTALNALNVELIFENVVAKTVLQADELRGEELQLPSVKMFDKSANVRVFATIHLKTRWETPFEQGHSFEDVKIENCIEEVVCSEEEGSTKEVYPFTGIDLQLCKDIPTSGSMINTRSDARKYNNDLAECVVSTPLLTGLVSAVKDHTYVKVCKKSQETTHSKGTSSKPREQDVVRKSVRFISQRNKRNSFAASNKNKNCQPISKGRDGTDARKQRMRTRSSTSESTKVENCVSKLKSAKRGSIIAEKKHFSPFIARSATRSGMSNASTTSKLTANLRNLPRKLNVQRILPPVQVQSKRSNLLPKNEQPLPKRRSIRKYSKNFTTSK